MTWRAACPGSGQSQGCVSKLDLVVVGAHTGCESSIDI